MSNSKSGDASPTILFIFSMLTIMFACLGNGYLDNNALLLLGCIQLGVFPLYAVCAIFSILKDDSISGNCFLIFASLFGGAGGLCNLATYFSAIYGWPIDSRIMGIVWICSGLMLIPIVSSMRSGPSIPFLIFALAAAMLVCFGITALGYATTILAFPITIMQFIVGFGGFYICIANLFLLAGIPCPLGRPLYKS